MIALSVWTDRGMGMNSLRVALCGAAIAVAAAASPAGATTTTVTSGDFASDSYNSVGGTLSLDPGSYRFDLSFDQPVTDVNGWVEKLFVYNDTCNEGEGEFYCGGDEDSIIPLFEMVTPELYQLTLTVNGPRTIFGAPGDIVVREDQFDNCCTYGFEFTGGAAGHYALSVASIPEPATWAMMLIGFGAIGAAARRRQMRNLPATS